MGNNIFRNELNKIFSEAQSEKRRYKDIFDFELVDYVKETIIPNKAKLPLLYRYSPADYNNIRNIEKEELFLSDIRSMNDIFEGVTTHVSEDFISHLDDLKGIAYCKSFTENKNDLLMWSHYADEYRGMCVEYDLSKLSENILYHLFPVIYQEQKINSNFYNYALESYADYLKMIEEQNEPNNPEDLLDILSKFIIKSRCWKEENEWRIIAAHIHIYDEAERFDDAAVELYNLESNLISVKNCIKTIYLGPQMPNNKKEHLKEIARKIGNIDVYEAKMSPHEFKLDLEKCKQ